ncbi:MAG: DUF3267 domain-containing protein [Clostridium sp.]|nr:DUF3267 domain-containing protein [Clostridium sp.]
MIITSAYPNFLKKVSVDYTLKSLDNNTLIQQKRYTHVILLIIHYVLCFYLGFNLFNFGDKFVTPVIYFLIYLILVTLLISLIHVFLHFIIFPINTWKKDCYIGFSLKHLTPFCYCNKELKRWKLIISTILPFIFLTIIPFKLYVANPTNMLLFSIIYSNSLLSAFDIYNLYILLFKKITDRGLLLKSNNKFYLLHKKAKQL